ncbi:unnamed protein product, partial [Gulo gulo]
WTQVNQELLVPLPLRLPEISLPLNTALALSDSMYGLSSGLALSSMLAVNSDKSLYRLSGKGR